MTDGNIDRRTVIGMAGSVAATGLVAGCFGGGGGDSADGGGGSGATTTGSGSGGGSEAANAVEEYLADVSNFDGIEDHTGESEVTVEVGVGTNAYRFGPAAVRVEPGTGVVWEWTGNGGSHNVVAEGGDFGSGIVNEAGHTFGHTFENTGAYRYYCAPHRSFGMKGGVVVE